MIPDFQTIMLPLLKEISNRNEFTAKDVNSNLSKYFNLTDDELQEMLPSGKQAVFVNRVAWAKAHLKIAGLLESPKEGVSKLLQKV